MRLFVSVVVGCLLHTAALAADCGDATGPGGTRVPCACGDTVTTDTKLKATDPVVSTDPADVCTEDGLQIGSDVTLNCNKLTIRGSGDSCNENECFDGILIETDNSTVKNCTVAAFKNGIKVTGSLNFTVQFNTLISNGIGVEFQSNSFRGTVRDNEVGDNRLGIHCLTIVDVASPLKGVTNVITKNRIFGNEGGGIAGSFCFNNHFTGNTIEHNGGAGISMNVFSERNEITQNYIHDNNGPGISVDPLAVLNLIANNMVSRNGEAGILVQSWGNAIVSNFGKQNAGNGLQVTKRGGLPAVGNTVADNEFNRNGGHGICVIPDTIDGGGNIGKNNGVLPDVTFEGCE